MSAETGCFYVPLGEERFRATELTATPWGSGSQHGGPPPPPPGRAPESAAGVAHLRVPGLLARRPRTQTSNSPRPREGRGEALLRDGPRGRIPPGHRGQVRGRIVARSGECRGLATHAG